MKKTHTHIVGWGIAGANIAWQLHQRNLPFTVYNKDEENASTVAAGLVNPVVFKRLTKSWKADTLLPYAEKVYTEIESALQTSFTSRLPIRRIFASLEEQNNWTSIYGDGRHDQYMDAVTACEHPKINAPFLSGTIHSIGHVNTSTFLEKLKTYFLSKGISFEHDFDYADINTSDRTIFCEGHLIKNNPYFNYLPLKPTHGEVITIHAPQLQLSEIINKNMFILPLGNNLYKVGSTYNWELNKPITSTAAKIELCEKMREFISVDFTVVNHEAGIRPTVLDRRPLIGKHPEKAQLFVFNGMGTKGVMIAPYYAHQLIEFIDKNQALDEEVNIERFSKHYNV